MLLNYGVEEDSWEFLGWQRNQTRNPKDNQSWIFIGKADAEVEIPILRPWCKNHHWKRPWCWESLKAGEEGDNRGWDGWMASLTWWTWVWGSLGSWWWTGKPGVLQPIRSQRVGHDGVTELNWHTSKSGKSSAPLSWPYKKQ